MNSRVQSTNGSDRKPLQPESAGMSTVELPPQPPVDDHRARLALSPMRADAGALAAESGAGASGPLRRPDDVVVTVEAARKAISEDEFGEPAEYRRS